MSVSGKPGTGGSVQTQFKYERYLDDDAHLIDTADGVHRTCASGWAATRTSKASPWTSPSATSAAAKPSTSYHDEQGFSIFRTDEVERTQELLHGTELLQTLMAEVMLRGMSSAGRRGKADAASI